MNLKNKKILLIIGGGISAYKSLDLIRLLQRKNCSLKIILTKTGKKFVTSLSISSLSKSRVFEDTFGEKSGGKMDHIALSRWADVILVLPSTANFMSKLSRGSADDLATTVILASDKETFLIPAMNVRMWEHKATQKNLRTLFSYGYKFIGPLDGEMACGEYGKGKMSSPRQIISYLENFFKQKDYFKKKNIRATVTAGPTREYIDPVRYISNESSGKQGYEIALELSRLGIKTTLISGPTNINYSNEIKVKKITSGRQMFNEVKKALPTDIAVCTAAVSDFRPIFKNKQKLKKKISLDKIQLEQNPDILEFLGKNNRHKPKLLVGFSAETENIVENSIEKIKEKHCDLIIANDVSKKDSGFNVDQNEIVIIYKNGDIQKVKKSSKKLIASIVTKKIINSFLDIKKRLN